MRPLPASYLWTWFAALTLASAFPVEEDVVVVPYDESRPLAEQTPRNYYLDSRTFEKLWEKAGRPRPDSGPGAEEPGYALVEALHDAQWQEEGLLVKARYRLLVTGSSWGRVPFSFPGAVVKTTTVDGEPAAYDNGDLLVKEPGWHQIETDYQVPEAANGREAQWSVPPATAALLHVRGIEQAPVINAGLPVMVDRKGDDFVVTAALGRTTALHLVLEGPARTPAVERSRLAKVESLLTIRPGLRTLVSQIAWEFPGSSLRHFAVDFDPAYAPGPVGDSNLETWKFVRGGPSGARLEFGLTAPVTGTLAIAMTAESSAGTGRRTASIQGCGPRQPGLRKPWCWPAADRWRSSPTWTWLVSEFPFRSGSVIGPTENAWSRLSVPVGRTSRSRSALDKSWFATRFGELCVSAGSCPAQCLCEWRPQADQHAAAVPDWASARGDRQGMCHGGRRAKLVAQWQCPLVAVRDRPGRDGDSLRREFDGSGPAGCLCRNWLGPTARR